MAPFASSCTARARASACRVTALPHSSACRAADRLSALKIAKPERDWCRAPAFYLGRRPNSHVVLGIRRLLQRAEHRATPALDLLRKEQIAVQLEDEAVVHHRVHARRRRATRPIISHLRLAPPWTCSSSLRFLLVAIE